MRRFYKSLFFMFGWLCVGLGILGAILPLMPSTVFFILAAWAFARSSDKFYGRLINDPYIGIHVRNYLEKRGMPLRAKFISITMLFITIAVSIYFTTRKPFAIVMLLSVAFGVAGYIISLHTIRKNTL
ncbi:MAG: YbaN family protein [Ignavibacteria bacterium]|nr:YbaN family protein [Ignavibacteria bacterium]